MFLARAEIPEGEARASWPGSGLRLKLQGQLGKHRGIPVAAIKLKNQRNDFEDACLSHLKALLSEGVGSARWCA